MPVVGNLGSLLIKLLCKKRAFWGSILFSLLHECVHCGVCSYTVFSLSTHENLPMSRIATVEPLMGGQLVWGPKHTALPSSEQTIAFKSPGLL